MSRYIIPMPPSNPAAQTLVDDFGRTYATIPNQHYAFVQAWTSGLEHFLSNAPLAGALDDVADTLSASSDYSGAVVVRAMNGTGPALHGPGLGLLPRVLVFSPEHVAANFSY